MLCPSCWVAGGSSGANIELSETLIYDSLNQVTQSTVSLSPTVKISTYDPLGNLPIKSDVGPYTYAAAGSPQPRAVTSISGGWREPSVFDVFTSVASTTRANTIGDVRFKPRHYVPARSNLSGLRAHRGDT
jgi:hypothetical protein